jgi:HSP20 family protein
MATGTAKTPTRNHRSVTWTDPLRLFRTSLSQEPYDLFRHLAPSAEETPRPAAWTPPCDIYETDAEIVVCAELPGASREDIHVTVESNTLTLGGERPFVGETTRDNYHRAERSPGEFMRSFALPNTVDPNRIRAEFNNGLLTVVLPKREEAQPKQIQVNVT